MYPTVTLYLLYLLGDFSYLHFFFSFKLVSGSLPAGQVVSESCLSKDEVYLSRRPDGFFFERCYPELPKLLKIV